MPILHASHPHSVAAPVQKSFNKGDVLFKEGDTGKEMYLILEGKVGVFKTTAKGKAAGAVIGAGGSIGEQSFFDNHSPTMTAVALEPVRALVINEKIFQSVMATVPSWLFSMIKVIVHRLRDVRKRVDETALRDPERGFASLIRLLLSSRTAGESGRRARDESRIIDEAVTIFGFEEKTARELLAGLLHRGILIAQRGAGGSGTEIVMHDPDVVALYIEYLTLKSRQETFKEAAIPPELVAVLSNIAYVAQKSGHETEEGTALDKSALIEDLAGHFDAGLLDKNLSELCRCNCITLMPSEHETIIYFKPRYVSRIKKVREWLPKFLMTPGGQA